ncbi:MAG TPA: hypothetical protein VJU15_00925 [Gemmatimonadales bacterium]|nr:hypothetical protein [Gemmatimonadales bacterium]
MSAFRSKSIALLLLASACGGSDSDGLGPSFDTSLGFQGTWIGKWGMGSAAPSNSYTVIVGPNHTLTVYDGRAGQASKGTGSWTLDDGALLGKFAYTSGDTLFVTGALANDGAQLQGRWGRGSAVQGTYWGDKQ